MRRIPLVAALFIAACADPAQFRPANGVGDLPSVSEALRVPERNPACQAIGVVTEAKTIDAIAITAARHGGTHFRVTTDFEGDVVGKERVIGQNLGVPHSGSKTREVREHHLVAEVYRCNP